MLLGPRRIGDRKIIRYIDAFGISHRQMEEIIVDPGRGFSLPCRLKPGPK